MQPEIVIERFTEEEWIEHCLNEGTDWYANIFRFGPFKLTQPTGTNQQKDNANSFSKGTLSVAVLFRLSTIYCWS